MFFPLIKWYARLAIKIYCRKIVINKPELLQVKGPLLLAANHPNSFLDGVILTTLFDEDIFSLARGDAFKNKFFARILRKLHQLPVYRTSEGVENLGHNYTTFDVCRQVFEEGKIVLIFSEGACKNEWHLRPLKKGTARLATSSWLKGIDLTVIPVGFNYNTFRNFGKNVFINFGEPIDRGEVMQHESDGKLFLSFNEQLQKQLKQLVFEIPFNDKEKQKELLTVPVPVWKKTLLALPALAGLIIHAPLYFGVKLFTKAFFDNDHFDSVVASVLMLKYPFYVLLGGVLAGIFFGWPIGVLTVIAMPFLGWAAVHLKKQV